MKTAISIPDPIFQAAEGLAHRLGISRSELYAKAVAEYMKPRKDQNITKKLDEIYENGKAELVIQDAKSYEEMVNLLASLKKIASAAQQHDEGKAIPAGEAFEQLRQRLLAKHPDAEI